MGFRGRSNIFLRPQNKSETTRTIIPRWENSVRWPVSRVLFPPKREMAIPLGRPSPDASRDLPGQRLETAIAVPIWSCSRWGLPCRLRCRRRGALLPHHFNLAADYRGGLLSVALSLELPPPDVIRHRVSVEPGLSSHLRATRFGGRPSGHLTHSGILLQFARMSISWSRAARMASHSASHRPSIRAGRK